MDQSDDEAMEVEEQPPPAHRRVNQRRDSIPRDFRKWERVSRRSAGNPFRFKVVSYNVLAQNLLDCHPYLYTNCDPFDLDWNVRSKRILKEILDLDPDILCLQEVQSTHIRSFYGKIEKAGYYGLYKQKTGHKADGCAIYFKKDVFDLEDHLSVEYYQPEMRLLNRDNVGIMLKLAPRECPHIPIVVATTHLLYNPNRADVRLAQMQVMLAELDRFAYFEAEPGEQAAGYHPIILTGDFNSTPESEVIKLLDTGKTGTLIPFRDCFDWRRLGVTSNCQHLSVHLNRPRGLPSDFSTVKYDDVTPEIGLGGSESIISAVKKLSRYSLHHAIHKHEIQNSELSRCYSSEASNSAVAEEMMRHSELFNSPLVQHPLKLASVYRRTKLNNNEEATTFQDYWTNVDYMYFSCCNKLKLLERLRLPTTLECQVLGSLPNDVYGSDHLVLAAHFEVRETTLAH